MYKNASRLLTVAMRFSFVLCFGLVTLGSRQTTTVQAEATINDLQLALGPDIVINGSFETPIVVRSIGFDEYPAGQSLGGWTIESGEVDHVSQNYWQASEGLQSVDVTGSPGSGTMYQDLPTIPQQTYRLNFDLSGNPVGAPSIKQMEVWWGTTLLDTVSYDTTGNSRSNMAWRRLTYLVTATTTTTRLTFKSLTTGYYGPVIDNVAIRHPIDRQIMVTGCFLYVAPDGVQGLSYARVEIWDDNTTTADQLLYITYANVDGCYEAAVVSTEADGPDLYAKVYTRDDQRVWVGTSADDINSAYWARTSTRSNVTGGTVDFGSSIIDPSAKALYIYDLIADKAWNYLRDTVNWENNFNLPVEYPSTHPLGTRFIVDDISVPEIPPRIYVASYDDLDHDVILHEYAHFVMYKTYGYESLLRMTNDCMAHMWEEQTNNGCAWVEGWANFLQGAIQNDQFYVDVVNHTLDINMETDDSHMGPDVEGAVSAALWDIFDNQSESWDTIPINGTYFNGIWNIFFNNKPQDINQFLSAWLNSTNGFNDEIQSIFAHHGIGTADAFNDEFNTTSLDPRWRWISEEPSKWSLSASPGNLQIIASRGDLRGSCNNAQNILLQDAPSGDFEITTKVSFYPTVNYQQGGLLIFVDNNNYIKLDAIWNNTSQGGQSVEIIQENQGVFPSTWPWINVSLGAPAYLKIRKSGNVYIGLYSVSGQLWNTVGSVTAASTIVNPKIGLFALTSAGCLTTSAPDISVNFDFFRVSTEPSSSFEDVPPTYWAWSFIERLYSAGITGGCGTSPLQYCPETTVTRSQMAVFLLRGLHGSSYSPPAIGGSTGFGDVPPDYWSAVWIKELAAEGITGGCGNGNYCPEYPVTRDQMAVFLLRSKYGSSYSPPAVGGSTGFGDVPVDHWAAPWIKQLVTEGITAGCGSGNYCPDLPVTRAQMAVFLVRTFNLP